jgi:mannose-6-phosphate isomerase-like protein (cupin superfamily)
MNAIRMPANWEHYPEHDHAADNEEELYIPIGGSGTLHAEGQSYPIERGDLIRVGPTTKRKIVPGAEGMTLLVLSDRPDSK